MTEAPTWNDDSRDLLRETIRDRVLGEIRLANSDRDDILQTCREVHIDDECPEPEIDAFVEFAQAELDSAIAKHAADASEWPSETDCDRLDRVEAELRERGILLWQVSPCCDTCTGAELPGRIDVIDRRFPGFREKVRVRVLHRSKHA